LSAHRELSSATGIKIRETTFQRGGVPLEPLEAVQTLIFMSVVVEALTAVFRQFVSKKATQLVSMLVGVTLCFAYQVGIFTSLGLRSNYPFVDYLVSGIIISQGSNALSELFKLRHK